MTNQANVNEAFCFAIRLGHEDKAMALMPDVDWSRFVPGERNPVSMVLDKGLHASATTKALVEDNRKAIADHAFEGFLFEDWDVESMNGFGCQTERGGLPRMFHRSVYCLPTTTEHGDSLAASSTQRVRFNVEFAHVGNAFPMFDDDLNALAGLGPEAVLQACQIVGCKAVDGQGNDAGFLPDMEVFHERHARVMTARDAHGFALRVMQWCVDAGRSDLLACPLAGLVTPGAREHEVEKALHSTPLMQAIKIEHMEALQMAIAHGADPKETLGTDNDKTLSVLHVLENLDARHGRNDAGKVRAAMSHHAAKGLLDGLLAERKVSSAQP